MSELINIIMLQITTNPWINLVYFSFLVLSFHVIFIFISPLSKLKWKKIDYIYLGMAAISALAITIDNRISYSQIQLTQERAAIYSEYSLTREGVLFNKRYFCGTKFVKGEYSPANFDDLIIEQKRLCDFFSLALDSVLKESKADKALRSRINYESLPNLTDVSDSFRSELSRFFIQANDYNRDFDLYNDLQKKSDSDYNLYKPLAPLLLPIALALRVTKVTGEIMLEKASEASKKIDNVEQNLE
jgi:hypothetical protein